MDNTPVRCHPAKSSGGQDPFEILSYMFISAFYHVVECLYLCYPLVPTQELYQGD